MNSLFDALGAAGGVLDTPRRLVAQGVGSLLGNQDIAESGDFSSPLLRALGVNPTDTAGSIGKSVIDAATDPVSYLGAGLALKGAKMAHAAATRANVAKMLPLRREITAIKDVRPSGMTAYPFEASRMTGAQLTNRELPLVMKAGGQELFPPVGGPGFGMNGAYVKWQGSDLPPTIFTVDPRYMSPDATPQRIFRHELSHAMGDQAAQQGIQSQLPAALQPAARLQNATDPDLKALGVLFDEMAAHGAERAGRGAASLPANQRGFWRGVYNFLDEPLPGYTRDLTERSPFVGDLYASRDLARAVDAARELAVPAAAGAAGLGGLGYLAFGGNR